MEWNVRGKLNLPGGGDADKRGSTRFDEIHRVLVLATFNDCNRQNRQEVNTQFHVFAGISMIFPAILYFCVIFE